MNSVPAPAERARLRAIRDLPGPRGMPLLGNALQIDQPRLHAQLEDWCRQYGERFRVAFGPRRFLVTANADDIAQVLKDRPEGFSRTSRLEAACREMGAGGLFAANGAQWRRQRPLIMSAFNPAHVKAYFPSLATAAGRLSRRWERLAAQDAPFELEPELMRYTVDITAGLAFGSDINTIENDGAIIQRHLQDIFRMLQKRLFAVVPYWRWIRFKEDRQLERDLRAVAEAVSGFLRAARARMAAEPWRFAQPQSLLEAMLAARDEEAGALTETELAGNVVTMLLAGEDTTAHTLAWLILLLHHSPRWLDAARAEVDTALGGHALPQSHEQLAGLEIVDACLQEAMRMKPVGPVIACEARRDSVIGDIAVPRGASVMLLTRVAPLDERHFAHAGEFDPGRWLGDAANGDRRKTSIPFGAGPRICPGRYLALEEMKMFMAMLLRGFDIVDAGARGGGGAVRERLSFTLAPVDLMVRLQRR
ncbi:cytochrome P450 [Noviherbaspirillum pedocola]|uniref:Cytochrome P450 n=1 Tax=Noviherbaspirillum pedocola TaxID=2801341 RepID=A0A934T236_9BURK|nr:cytochrome P450 [Noviherbaspirillum pedocola]MBK4737564.1 cytochrome P450 [Noviherbaspirillum pedocola]